MRKPFFIFGTMRSGSTMLIETLRLAGLPVVRHHWEFFNHRVIHESNRCPYLEDGELKWRQGGPCVAKDDKQGWWEEVHRRIAIMRELKLTFKVFPMNVVEAPEALTKFLQEYDCYVLERHDRYKQFLSYAKGWMTYHWSTEVGGPPEVMIEPTAIPFKLFEDFATEQRMFDHMKSSFNVVDTIVYEDICKDQSIIGDVFDVDVSGIQSGQIKNRQDDAWVLNKDEVISWLKFFQ